MDETFIVAAPATVARLVADSSRWPRWWPGLVLTVAEDRGPAGIRWQVGAGTTRGRSTKKSPLTGTMEIWVEPHQDGVIAHYYLRVDPTGRRMRRRARHKRARQAKHALWSLKDELERGRPVGEPLRSPRPTS